MTIKFRLNAVVLHTTEGEVRHEFSSDLTVLEGPTGAGKTTLLELIKYGFAAGEARLASVATESVNDVALDVIISDEHFLFLRSLDAAKSKNVRIVDLHTGERLPDHTVGDGELSFNRFLLGKLGLPDDIKAAAQKSRSSKAGSRVTFGDVFKYLYVPQYAVNRDIADSRDGYYDPKRKAVFELLFKLTEPAILEMQSNVNILNGKIDSEAASLETVLTFLGDSNTSSREEVEQALREAVSEQQSAQVELNAIREEIAPVVDRQTQVYRDLLTDAERTLSEARSAVQDLLREREEILLEKKRVKADSARLERMRDAGARLANIEFAACPRCMQSLKNRSAGNDVCRLCLQPEPVESNRPTDSYELQQLELQTDEMEAQLEVTEQHLQRAYRAVDDRESLVKNLTETLESRTANRITPRLQAFSDASDRLATARTRQEAYELVLQQWDRVADIEREVQGHRTEQERLKAEIAARKTALAEHKEFVLSRIEEEFRKVVSGLKIATVESCGFDRENYLPLINGKVFAKTLMSGGGSMTATQIAYWASLLTVAREVDCRYPSILVIDGPRLALNTATDTCAAIYKRLVGLANEVPGAVQLIVSDNELPDEYQGEFDRIMVDYHHPTVATVPHPGEGLVDPIASVDE